MIARTVLVAAALLISTTSAQAQEKPSTQKQGDVGTPNEKVCEDVPMIGSRLAKKRFCGTKAEWADRKRQDREALEKAQMSPCVRDGLTCK
jgi:hypothetical protein